jgi:phospholipase/carboxylesterase
MMSLYTGPRRKGKIAGVLGYSGALVWEEDVDSATLQKPPVHLIHGSADEIVPPLAYNAGKQMLENAGFTVTGSMTPGLAHSIDPAGIESGRTFLRTAFS